MLFCYFLGTERMDLCCSPAVCLLRTEMNYVNNRANWDRLEEAEMKQFRFVATLDKRTSAVCRAHDGKIYDLADAKQGSNVPPLHPHCRSVIVGYIGGDLSKRIRIARDKGGKNMDLPANKTYENWKAVYIDKAKTLKEWKARNAPKVEKKDKSVQMSKSSATIKKYMILEF